MTKKLLGSLELNRIYQRDCLEGMAMIPDKSVDLIVIDPPYNIGKDKRWDKWKTVDDYVNWMTDVFKECERVLKENGSFYWFHNDMGQIRKLMDSLDMETIFNYKQLITWNKIDPTFKNYGYVQQRLSIDMMRNFYNGFTEYCLFYTKELNTKSFDTGWEQIKNQQVFKEITDIIKQDIKKSGVTDEKIYELAFTEGRYKTRSSAKVNIRYKLGMSNGHRFDFIDEKMYRHLSKEITWSYSHSELCAKYNDLRGKLSDLVRECEEKRYAFNTAYVKEDLRANSNVWLYPPAENLGHITPKPVDLVENIIRHSSDECDVVLDCFMGSGTTAVAASRLNRNFIGFERESDYVKIANRRLESLQDEIAERKLTE